jgi:hypothetical protein
MMENRLADGTAFTTAIAATKVFPSPIVSAIMVVLRGLLVLYSIFPSAASWCFLAGIARQAQLEGGAEWKLSC